MVYEFIATVASAFALAGVALIISHIAGFFNIVTPKWLMPVFAAIGIFSFQVHQEYNWYQQTAKNLPQRLSVVKEVRDSSWYRPWSYIEPQVVRFMAVEKHNESPISHSDILIDLYFFERRMSVKKVSQVVDCDGLRMSGYTFDEKKQLVKSTQWTTLVTDEPLFQTVCT